MNKRKREQLVELLRCAADCGSLFKACVLLDRLHLEDEATIATWSAKNLGYMNHSMEQLEAAQRIEEGSYP